LHSSISVLHLANIQPNPGPWWCYFRCRTPDAEWCSVAVCTSPTSLPNQTVSLLVFPPVFGWCIGIFAWKGLMLVKSVRKQYRLQNITS